MKPPARGILAEVLVCAFRTLLEARRSKWARQRQGVTGEFALDSQLADV